MAKVPVYGAPQVSPTALGAPRTDAAGPKSNTLSPDFFGAVEGKQQAALGVAVAGAAAAAGDIVVKMQERENADSIFRAEVGLKEEYLKTEQEWHEKRRGRFAQDLTTDAQQWWDDAGRRYSETLTPVQQREFAKRLANLRIGSLNSVSRFQASELEKSHDESFEANKKITISLAAQNPTEENIAATREQIKTDNTRQAARKGWSAERLAAENLGATTLLHKNIIQGMVKTDPAGAKLYFDNNKNEIDGTQHAEIGEFARKASATAIGHDIADAVWLKTGPKNANDPVDIFKMEEELRKGLKDNPDALDAALRATRERTNAFNASQREYAAANGSAVANAINEGMPSKQVMLMPEYLNLTGEKRLQFKKYIEDQEWQAQGRAHTVEQRKYTSELRADLADRRREDRMARENNAGYLRYSDPTILTGMSRREVEALLPTLGRVNTDKLLHKFDQLKGDPNKVIEAKIDQDDFNHILQGAGFSPFDPKKNEDDRAALGALKFHIENLIDREQAVKKRQLTRQEKQELMTRTVDDKVLVERFFSIFGQKPASVSVPLLTGKQAGEAFVEVDGQRIKISSVPATERVKIIKKLEQERIPATEQNIATAWARSKNRRQPLPE